MQVEHHELYHEFFLLTRKETWDYADYIAAIERYGVLSVMIKIADLTHNLSDSRPGSQRDKYMLAFFILTKGNTYKEAYPPAEDAE